MINPEHLRKHVIRPVLELIGGRADKSVEDLLLGTAAQESQLGYYLKQIDGPALGIYQIESETHKSVWDNYLAYRPDLASKIRSLASQKWFLEDPDRELVFNLAYATAIARLVYLPVPKAIPNTTRGQAEYWKKHYNTHKGRGSVDEYLMNYYRYVDDRK